MSLRNTLPFATIPEWLLEADVSDRAVRVYAVLVRHADKEGHAFPSYRRMAERLRCSERSIMRAVQELVEIGVLQVSARRREDDGGQTSNDYLLTPGGDTADTPAPDTTAAPGVTPPSLQEREPLEREPSEREKDLPTPRKRDVIADALAIAEGSDPLEVPASRMRTLCVKANELRKVAPMVMPAEVASRAARWESHFGDAAITGPAIVTHWARLKKFGPGKGKQWAEHPLDAMARRHLEEVNGAHHNGGGRSRPAAVGELSSGPG